MRISDWSSDVCSSDLVFGLIEGHVLPFGELFVEPHFAFSGHVVGNDQLVHALERVVANEVGAERTQPGFLVDLALRRLVRNLVLFKKSGDRKSTRLNSSH